MAASNTYKVFSLPTKCEPNAYYIVVGLPYAESYYTDSLGTPRELGNTTMIQEVIANMKLSNAPATENTTFLCGEIIPSHTPIAIVNGLAYRMNNLNPLHQFAFVGFSKTSGTPNTPIPIENNFIQLIGWGLEPNTIYLAGPNGTLIKSNTATDSFTKIIGISQSGDDLLIIKDYSPINKTN